ncbi:MAG: M14 family metallopeptidase [candidate division WOR-3 bacterium]
MRRSFILLALVCLLSISYASERTMVVRVYVNNYEQLFKRIDFKYSNIEICGTKPHEWYELIVPQEDYPTLLRSGLRHDIVISDLESVKEEVRGQYRSLDSINLYLRNLCFTYPSLCVMESLGLSYEGRQMYGIKISDNPNISEPDEPGVFICALHHSREWATPEVVLFFADSILRAYNFNPAMANLINNHEIWIFPVINPDGYVYDYPAQRSWRKNRQPFQGVIGTDINRNYLGSCDGNRFGLWGALTSGAQSSHYPSSETFMGGYGASSPEISNVINFFRTHNINTAHSFHSYSELVLWPWGYQNTPTPDNALFVRVGTAMANLITKVGGSGTYTPGQIPSLYPVSSGADDWIYGYNKFVKGNPCLAFTNEVGTSFYQSVSQLDQICRQNFKSIYYLANFSDSVRILI